MSEILKVLVMGGHTERFHQFSLMGPIYHRFLSEAGFEVTLSEDRDDFLSDRVTSFDVIVDYTTGGSLTEEQEKGLLGAITRGKGFVGVHSATDSFKDSPRYLSMVGGRFLTHPEQQEFAFKVLDRDHPVTAGVEDWSMVEELYLMETIGDFKLLMSTGFRGFERPVTWVKPYGLGRVCYTALGHAPEQHEHPQFQKLVVNAINWVSQTQ